MIRTDNRGIRNGARAGGRAGAAALALAGALFLPPLALGAVSALLPDGTLHTVSVESRAPSGTGTRLVDTIRTPDGSVRTTIVPGTDDSEVESDPALTVPPASGQPALFWARTSAQGGEIFASWFNGSSWCTARALTANTWDDSKPQPVAGLSGHVHVMWRALPPGQTEPSFFLTVLDGKGGSVLAPYEVRVAPGTSSSSTGLPTEGFSDRPILFAFDASSRTSGPSVVAYGGTDEPIPTLRRIDFRFLDRATVFVRVRIERAATLPLLLLTTPKAVVWTAGMSAGWTPYATLALDAVTEDKAELLIRDMLGRAPTK